MLFKSVLGLVFVALSLFASAHAAELKPATRKAIEGTVSQINQAAKIGSITPGPIAGLNEVLVDGVVLYISDDGKYLFHGTLLDVVNRRNLTDIAGAAVRKDTLASLKDADKIIYKPAGKTKYKVVVFTDISCHYCHRVHENIKGYLDRGIQVEYVAFPRGGPQSPVLAQMEQIWCSKDRNAAYDAAVAGKTLANVVPCDNPVRAQYDIGDKLGIQGTPAIYSYDGMQHGGYIAPEQLLQALENKRQPGSPDPIDDGDAEAVSSAP